MELSTSRPRVIGWLRGAAILDGDWGTSICYVLGIAFYRAGYFSGWHLMMMIAFTALISLNYVTICRLYPGGGGVYSSVSHRSRTFAALGALLLSAGCVVLASLSALDAGGVAIVISFATHAELMTLVAVTLPGETLHIVHMTELGGVM